MTISRRTCLRALAGGAALPMIAGMARASSPTNIDWPDLIPKEADFSSMRGIVAHGAPSLQYDKKQGEMLTQAYSGQVIRIPGFILPTDFEGTSVTSFLLVPYVGACIHVPPPPPNQMVFVTYDQGFEGGRMFSAVHVTGTMKVGLSSTSVAPVGYTMTADSVENYKD